MREGEHSAYRVPTGRPFLLGELYNKLPSVDDRMKHLPDPADPTEYEAIADALWDVFVTARNLAPVRSPTGCARHPGGPVDTEAPEGWGRCLLCNRNRRIGRPSVKKATNASTSLWAIPDPPYNHAALMAIRRTINHAVMELDYRSPDRAFHEVADLVHSAFIIARELSRPRSTGCQRHPGAPIDPTAAGGPQCIFCVGEERRRQLGPPTVTVRPSRPVPTVRPPVPRRWQQPLPPPM
ncbi:hypothetical protein ACFZAR_40915 [Streptomyces sp. NPDC008222]|uniref:hypothetical protein n=1 Tax=Streptomyces sp. NPDC008222 TaxID=3364820 RepID=UPI0036E9734F